MLTTEQFFSSVNYLTTPGDKRLSELKSKVEIDPLSHGVESLFNHFAIFRYTDNIMEKYEPDAHFVGYNLRHNFDNDRRAIDLELAQASSEINKLGGLERDKAAMKYNRLTQGDINAKSAEFRQAALAEFASNPTAGRLIDWSSTVSKYTGVGFQPYAWTDFAYCKFYGKIPNNRLITLRRYPFPVSDILKGADQKPLIPMAQAVTWFGGETDNQLSSIGNWVWDMPWEKLSVTEQQIEGNEVLVTDLTSLFAGVGGKFGTALEKSINTVVGSQKLITEGGQASSQISGYDAEIQKYLQGLYDKDKGPYWNRIYGPVNVIHESSRRTRGIQTAWQTPFTLKFHYAFRSFSGMSPKMTALDLMSNFMALTFNDAQFLGILGRYFPKPGLKFDGTTTQVLTDLLMSWGMGKLTTTQAMKSIQTIVKSQVAIYKQAGDKVSNDNSQFLQIANAAALSKLAGAMPKMLSVKSALSDRPVGEWHMVVGNPLNPIFVMGDLICTRTTAKFNEEIGPDDFPTGITFEVTLQQAKPRDKTAIERMLNNGLGSLTTTRLNPPSSASDTFGTENNDLYKKIMEGANMPVKSESEDTALDRYKQRVGRAYGIGADSSEVGTAFKNDVDSILTTYFRKNITKS